MQNYLRFEVVMVAAVKITVFWDVVLCILIKVYWHSEEYALSSDTKDKPSSKLAACLAYSVIQKIETLWC
jgi:hypothetical protein